MTTVRGDVATMSDSVLQDYPTGSHSSGIAPPEELAPLVARIKSGGGATNWAAVRYASPTSLAMLGSGAGGFVEMLGAFDDGAVAYGAFAAAIGTQLKLTFVSFVGPDVSGLERARVSMHRSDVMRFFDPVVSLDLQEKDDVATACDEMRAAVAATLSSVGDAASVRLNSNDAAEADAFVDSLRRQLAQVRRERREAESERCVWRHVAWQAACINVWRRDPQEWPRSMRAPGLPRPRILVLPPPSAQSRLS